MNRTIDQRAGDQHAGERSARRRGSILLETTIAIMLFTVVMLSAMSMIESGRKFSASTLESTHVEDLAQQMLYRFGRELASSNAERKEPTGAMSGGLAAGAGRLTIGSNLGFPPVGILILDRGTANEERVSYTSLSGLDSFNGLTRGLQCTADQDHVVSANEDAVMWSGFAEMIANQFDPAASDYDGISLEEDVPVFFRGDGTGFSYQVPVDPAGGNNYLNDDDLFWGSIVPPAGPTLDGWMALYFAPKSVFDEDLQNHDLNGDGDQIDIFDVGQIRRVSWDTTNANLREDIAMGPSAVIQEQCDWGGDLDNDDFDDPIFLYDDAKNLLHVRLFVLGSSREFPIVRLVESVLFLRNEPEL